MLFIFFFLLSICSVSSCYFVCKDTEQFEINESVDETSPISIKKGFMLYMINLHYSYQIYYRLKITFHIVHNLFRLFFCRILPCCMQVFISLIYYRCLYSVCQLTI